MTASTLTLDGALLSACARAKATYPTEKVRIEKGLALALSGAVVILPSGTCLVQSSCQPDVQYVVNGHCECKDAQYSAPEGRCKHRWSKALYLQATRALEAAEPADHDDAPADEPTAPVAPVIPAEYVTTIQGKQFVRYAGLLFLAHQRGLVSLVATWTYNDDGLSLAQATATFQEGRTFTEAGDATPQDVSKRVAHAFRRMALTRAKARALRDALNIDLCSVEELSAEVAP